MIEEIKKTAVIGSGMMGSQIAELLARLGGYEVTLVDLTDELVNNGIKGIADRIDRFFVSKGKMSQEERDRIMGLIKGNADMKAGVKDADFVIEAAIENLAIKKEIFSNLEASAPQHAIFASNTSYQNISEIAAMTKRPDKVVGTHFFNPVAKMALVEVVRGALTSDETTETAVALSKKLGKEPVVCRDFSYGFLANRAYLAMVKEAVQMVWEKVGSPEEIDKALRLGYNLPMGPLELFDFVGGWKIAVSSEQDEMREMGPEKGKLHPLIRMMSRAGYTEIYPFWKDALSKL